MLGKIEYFSPVSNCLNHVRSLEFVTTQYGFEGSGTLQPCDAIILDDGDPFEEWTFTVSNVGASPQITVLCDPNNPASSVQINAVNTDGNNLGCTSGGNPETGTFIPAGNGTVVIQIFANGAAGSDTYQFSVNAQDCDVSNVQRVTNSCTTGGCPV